MNDEKAKATALAGLVATGSTVRDAAKDLGIAEATAYRWARRKAFKREVSRIQDAAVTAYLGLLFEAHADAVGTLKDLMREGNAPTVRHKAAEAILSLGQKGYDAAVTRRELEEVKAAVADLEKMTGYSAESA